MDKKTIDEKLIEYGRKSKDIGYSPVMIEDTKNADLIIREASTEKDNHVWAIVLKCKLKEVPQEIILGTIGNAVGLDRKEATVKILDLIQKQLKDNAKGVQGYQEYLKLNKLIIEERIPFSITFEGKAVLAQKSLDVKAIPRTVYQNEGKSDILNKYTKEDLETMKLRQKNEIDNYMNEKLRVERWKSAREKILDIFSSEEEKQKFIRGEQIAKNFEIIDSSDDRNILEEKEKNIVNEKNNAKQKIVAEYFCDYYSEPDKLELSDRDKSIINVLFKNYLRIKEKGIAIDISRGLDVLGDIVCQYLKDRMMSEDKIGQNIENDMKDDKAYLEISKYKDVFELLKQGRDWNARIIASLHSLDIKNLKNNFSRISTRDLSKIEDADVLEDSKFLKDPELLEYMDLKSKMMHDTGNDNIDGKEHNYESVGNLYEFLLKSSIREKTQDVEMETIDKMFTSSIRNEYLKKNDEEIKLYNYYAKKFKMYECPMVEEDNKGER